MKRHVFLQKNRCKNCGFSGKNNYTHLKNRKSRINTAFLGRYVTRSCDKESRHDVSKILSSDGEDK